MWILAAVITSICFGVNNTIFRWSNGRGLSKVHVQFFFYLFAFILTLSYGVFLGDYHPSLIPLVLGSLIGILNANGNIQMARAFEQGPASLTSPLIAANAIFPVLGAALIFHESISLIQWLGIMCMLVAALVIQYSPQGKVKVQYVSWILHVTFAILSFGILGILMKTTSYIHIQSLDVLIAMYGGGSAYLLVNLLLMKKKVQITEVRIGSFVGTLSILGYACYFHALNTGVASIVFPVVSLNCLIVVLAGCYLYHEKLKHYQIAGVLAALIGIILTKI